MGAKAMHYTQVRLEQPHPTLSGTNWMHAWIPSPMSTLGRRVRIDGYGGTWKITERGETKEAAIVERSEDDYKHQREVSDV